MVRLTIKRSIFFMFIILLVLSGCASQPKQTQDGYIELASLKGSSNKESKEFPITVSENRMVIITEAGSSDGIQGQIERQDGNIRSTATFSLAPNQEQIIDYKLEPGSYIIKVQSTGTKYSISYQEKKTQK